MMPGNTVVPRHQIAAPSRFEDTRRRVIEKERMESEAPNGLTRRQLKRWSTPFLDGGQHV
ncbi:hypothetical protein SCLCIDRAFT_1211296, partial [Scleroderma citrinum Foug A]